MQNCQVADKRQSLRFPYRGDILIDGVKQCTCSDISEGGIFVCAMQAFEVGDVLDLSITAGGIELTVKGEVKYLQQGIGIGIAFRDLDAGQRAGIRELVDRLSGGD